MKSKRSIRTVGGGRNYSYKARDPKRDMKDIDLAYTSAVDVARLIRDKAISPVEVMESALARLEALNPTLNAVCTSTAESAMEAARAAEQAVVEGEALGPLHGVPTTIKDLTFTKGVKTMAGSHIFADRVPDEDALS